MKHITLQNIKIDDNQIQIAALGGIDDVLKAMRTHSLDAEVQRNACGSLWALTGNDANQIEIAAMGEAIDGFNEAPVAEHMKGQNIEIEVDVGVAVGDGAGSATVWTCDLTHGYITINADYRS